MKFVNFHFQSEIFNRASLVITRVTLYVTYLPVLSSVSSCPAPPSCNSSVGAEGLLVDSSSRIFTLSCMHHVQRSLCRGKWITTSKRLNITKFFLIYSNNNEVALRTVVMLLLGGSRRVWGSHTLGGSTVRPSIYSSTPLTKSSAVLALYATSQNICKCQSYTNCNKN